MIKHYDKQSVLTDLSLKGYGRTYKELYRYIIEQSLTDTKGEKC